MAKSKISRKKLLKEPDEFITFTGRLIEFIKVNQNKLIGAVAVISIVLVATSTIRYFSAKNEAEASLALAKAQNKYTEAISNESPENALQKVEGDFKKILDEYSGKNAGKRARLILGDIYFDAGKFDQAIELYKVSLNDWNNFPAIKNIILSSLGYAYEGKNELETALTYYEKINNSSYSSQKAIATYNMGRIYENLGKEDKSLESFKSVDKNYPNFIYSQIIKTKINS